MKTIERISEEIAGQQAALEWTKKNAPDSENLHVMADFSGMGVFCYDWCRDKILTEMAALFGADGWIATVKEMKINWSKSVDGMRIKIHDAKRMPKESTSYPVPPTDFPLQIANSNE